MALALNDLNDDVLFVLYEWLLAIADEQYNYLDQVRYRATRIGLSCANRRFRSLAQSLIFRSIRFSGYYGLDKNSVNRFLSVFGDNNVLQPKVRELEINPHGWSCLHDPVTFSIPKLLSTWANMCNLKTLHFDVANTYRADFELGFKDRSAPMFPNVTVLSTTSRDPYVMPHCPKVKELAITCDNSHIYSDRHEFDKKLAQCLMDVPPLDKLSFNIEHDSTVFIDVGMLETIIEQQATLRELHLEDKDSSPIQVIAVPMKILETLLRKLQRLETLHLPVPGHIMSCEEAYEASVEEQLDYGKGTNKVIAEVIGRRIMNAHATLREISFTHPYWEERKVSATRDDGGSLLSLQYVHRRYHRPGRGWHEDQTSEDAMNAWKASGYYGQLWLEMVGLEEHEAW